MRLAIHCYSVRLLPVWPVWLSRPHSRQHMTTPHDNRGFLSTLIGDGLPLLIFVGLALFLSGSFALFLAVTGHFLPHDIQYLGMSAGELCSLHGCRIVHFMMHDRAAFGGILAAVGLLYLWLAAFPMRDGEPWAWWVFLISGVIGFASFLAYDSVVNS